MADYLRRQGSTVSSHIVHEAMMNALRHPACRVIQATSFFDRPDTYRLRNEDLKAWRGFFGILNAARQAKTTAPTTPASRLWDYFPDPIKHSVTESKNGIPLRKDIGKAVLDAINTAITDRSFYRSECFRGVELPEEVIRLLTRLPYLAPLDVQKCNRYILDACFPESLNPTRRGHLTIVYRDDGENIIETLGKALRTPEKQIRSVTAPELHVGYAVRFEDELGRPIDENGEVIGTSQNVGAPKVYWSEFTPEPSAKEHLVLFSSLLPGITRDVSGQYHKVHGDVIKKQSILGMPGMGLYILTSEVVDVFGGTVAIRTGNYFVNIRTPIGKHDDGVRYAVKIRKYGGKCPPFPGNMLTIRLPLH